MKKIIFSIICSLVFSALCFSQVKKPTTTSKPSIKPILPVNILKSAKDSASYAMGVFIVSVYSQQGITDINSTLVAKAINDIQTKKPRLLDDTQANTAVMDYLSAIQIEKSKPNIAAGEKFLTENKKRAEVHTTSTGLQYEIITQGTGPTPVIGDSVVCNYKGNLVNGEEFDNSYSRGEPVTFSVTRVIAGWTEALLMMPTGSKWKVYVPYKLGYGASDYYTIPGGSMLIFEMELLGVKEK